MRHFAATRYAVYFFLMAAAAADDADYFDALFH